MDKLSYIIFAGKTPISHLYNITSMLQFEEVGVLDMNSEYRGVPAGELMENAGKRLAEEIENRYPDRSVLFICGTGNNGGDGYVAARYLSEWRGKEDVTVFLVKGVEGIRSELARKNLDRLECRVLDDLDEGSMRGSVIVDAMLGTGIKGSIREPYRDIIKTVNKIGSIVVSVDVPSGLGADIQVRPELTVTFHDKKIGMDEDDCGEIVIKDIGIPEEAERFTGPGELLLYPRPGHGSHKGENGTLLIIGGGPYTGAPALAAMAAYRTGVDLVHLAVPSSISNVVAGFSPSFIVHPLEGKILNEDHIEKISTISKGCDAILLGPGLGEEPKTLEACRAILKDVEIPVVIDADGLKASADDISILPRETILTPHRGEIKLFSETDTSGEEIADRLTEEYGLTVLLKGEVDYITDGERKKWNDFGTPAMTVGGTGDTLAGVTAGLLSKGMDPFDAARLGSYITCRAGELASEDVGYGLMPEDITEKIPKVLKP